MFIRNEVTARHLCAVICGRVVQDVGPPSPGVLGRLPQASKLCLLHLVHWNHIPSFRAFVPPHYAVCSSSLSLGVLHGLLLALVSTEVRLEKRGCLLCAWGGQSLQAEEGCLPAQDAVPAGLCHSWQDCWRWELCRAPRKVPVSSLCATLTWGHQDESLGLGLTECHPRTCLVGCGKGTECWRVSGTLRNGKCVEP